MKDKATIDTIDTIHTKNIKDKSLKVSLYRGLFVLSLLFIILEFALILVLQRRQTTLIPYVIEVQPDGSAKYIDNSASTLSSYTPSTATTLKVLENFIISLRSVNPDLIIQEERIKNVYSFATEDALKVAKDYLNLTKPYERSETERVEVTVYAATPLYKGQSNIYQLDWNERVYSTTGNLKSEANYRAVINTKVYQVRTKSLQEQNPLGIYLTNLEISKIRDGYVIYETE